MINTCNNQTITLTFKYYLNKIIIHNQNLFVSHQYLRLINQTEVKSLKKIISHITFKIKLKQILVTVHQIVQIELNYSRLRISNIFRNDILIKYKKYHKNQKHQNLLCAFLINILDFDKLMISHYFTISTSKRVK